MWLKIKTISAHCKCFAEIMIVSSELRSSLTYKRERERERDFFDPEEVANPSQTEGSNATESHEGFHI